MFNKKLSNYLSNISKINKISTNEIFNSFCFSIELKEKFDLSKLLHYNIQNSFYWEQPDNNFSFCALHTLKKFTANGINRTIETQEIINNLNYLFHDNLDKYNLDFVPMFVGGMKFSPDGNSKLWNDFYDSDWFIPKYLFLSNGNSLFFIYNFIFNENEVERIISEGKKGLEYFLLKQGAPETTKQFIVGSSNFNKNHDKTDWINSVNAVLTKIQTGDIKKVVLSRKVSMKFNQTGNVSILLKKLRDNYPRCYIFAFTKNGSIFFGASPEKLAKLSGGYIEADALAGSFPRGRTGVEDKILANELLNSKKNRAEQQAVVDSITNSFKNFSSNITYNKTPVIRKLPNIQHLWTPIKAKLNNGKTVLTILKELHPTPAICGTPYTSALLSIKQSEEHDRGLYAGIVGWFNNNNHGEFAVAIRSAILKNDELHAFAGCGIVYGSDPEAEYAETKLKLRPIFSLFNYETVNQS